MDVVAKAAEGLSSMASTKITVHSTCNEYKGPGVPQNDR